MAFAKSPSKNSRIKKENQSGWSGKLEARNSGYSLADNELPAWLSKLSKPNPSEDEAKNIENKDFRSPQHISQILNSHNEEIQACYYQHLKRNPNLAGKFVLRIFINPQGTVVNTEIVESTIKDEEFQKQIMSKILSWNNFGPGKGDQLMVYRQEYIFGE